MAQFLQEKALCEKSFFREYQSFFFFFLQRSLLLKVFLLLTRSIFF